MAQERDRTNRSDVIGGPTSTEGITRGFDGESYTVRTSDNTQGTRSNGATGDSTGTQEGKPEFTRPSTLELFGWNEEEQKEEKGRRGRPPGSTKNAVGAKNTPGINPKTCGNIVAGVVDFFSFLLTRTPILGLSDEEEREMGESLYETVSNFPATSSTIKLLNFLAPWAGLLHTSSKIVWKRLAFIEKHKVPKNYTPPPNKDDFVQARGDVIAPDPSLAYK